MSDNKEKKFLIFSLLSLILLSALLVFFMLKKDMQKQEKRNSRFEESKQGTENIWPKIEIETRK